MHDRTTVKESAITLATAGGSVPIEEMRRLDINGATACPCVVDPPATYRLFSVSLAERDGWRHVQGSGQATTVSITADSPLSKFGGLHVLADASSMLACAVEAARKDQDHGRR